MGFFTSLIRNWNPFGIFSKPELIPYMYFTDNSEYALILKSSGEEIFKSAVMKVLYAGKEAIEETANETFEVIAKEAGNTLSICAEKAAADCPLGSTPDYYAERLKYHAESIDNEYYQIVLNNPIVDIKVTDQFGNPWQEMVANTAGMGYNQTADTTGFLTNLSTNMKVDQDASEDTNDEWVKINGRGTSDSYGGGRETINFDNENLRIVKYIPGRSNPYALSFGGTEDSDIIGWFTEEQINALPRMEEILLNASIYLAIAEDNYATASSKVNYAVTLIADCEEIEKEYSKTPEFVPMLELVYKYADEANKSVGETSGVLDEVKIKCENASSSVKNAKDLLENWKSSGDFYDAPLEDCYKALTDATDAHSASSDAYELAADTLTKAKKLNRETIDFYLTVLKVIEESEQTDSSAPDPRYAGVVAAAGISAVGDGPLPFGDAVGLGILIIGSIYCCDSSIGNYCHTSNAII